MKPSDEELVAPEDGGTIGELHVLPFRGEATRKHEHGEPNLAHAQVEAPEVYSGGSDSGKSEGPACQFGMIIWTLPDSSEGTVTEPYL